jgi:hypothetical protein
LALVIAIVVIAVAVNSCEGSANKSALQNYADSVYSIIGDSHATSKALFATLAKAGSTDASATGQAVAQASSSADNQLKRAKRLNVPGLQERLDGLTNIASEIQPALGSEHQEAVQQITNDMALFLASDVEYKQYAVKQLVSALHGANIVVGGDNGTPVNSLQFLPSIDWLKESFVGAELGVSVSSGKSGSGSSGPVTGLHGDGLGSVSYNGATLSDGAAVTATPPPTFTLSVTNQGDFTESNVICKVEVVGTSVSGTKVLPSIAKGQTTTCDVTLRSSPPKGNYTIKAMVEKVPGEKDLTNNSQGVAVVFK